MEGLEFVNTENRKQLVRIVEGLFYVNLHLVILMEINGIMDIV